MKRTASDSFIAEFPLRTTAADERALRIRFEAARHIYNAALQESLRRVDRMRNSPAWAAARELPVGSKERSEAFKAAARPFATALKAKSSATGLEPLLKKPKGVAFTPEELAINKERRRAFKEARKPENAQNFDFDEYSVAAYIAGAHPKRCWIGDHLPYRISNTTAARAFKAAEQYSYGRRGRPRFKRPGGLNSLDNSNNLQDLQYFETHRKCAVPHVYFSGLRMPLILRSDCKDKRNWQNEALSRRVKFIRLLRRELRGRIRYYVQIVLEGLPPHGGRFTGTETIGIDLGPSTIAAVSGCDATLEDFAPGVTQPWRDMRRIERAMDRSKRATNPEAFNADGTYKRGARIVNRSRRYQKLAMARRERERRSAAERKRAHGELSNRILREGRDIKLELLSYRSFQKNFGRSVKVRAPGMFVSLLTRKAESAGGMMTQINPWKTALSQFDHTTREYVKKPLSQRVHVFGDGVTGSVQRDLYSAFLARHCTSEASLDVASIRKDWPVAASLLARAHAQVNQSANPRSYRSRGAGAIGFGCGADCTREGNMPLREASAREESAAGSAQNPLPSWNTS